MTARRRFWSMIANRPTKIAASRIVILLSHQQSESTSATGKWEWLQSMPKSNQRVTFEAALEREIYIGSPARWGRHFISLSLSQVRKSGSAGNDGSAASTTASPVSQIHACTLAI
jgi:hypothetical protein